VTADDVRIVESLLDQANGGRWTNQRLEQQDDGQFLLVSVEMDPNAEIRAIERVRADIRAILKSKLPLRPTDYAWMAVIKKQGTVIDSLMGGCSGNLPEV
jgi:hypothetical protein